MPAIATLTKSYTLGAALAFSIAVSGACSKSHSTAQTQPPAQVSPALVGSAAPQREEVHGQGHGRIQESVVFVDGKPYAVLRHGELPPGLKAHTGTRPPLTQGTSRFFQLYEWVEALGLDPQKVRAMHFYGSHHRVAMVDGDELVKFRERLIFDFSQAVRGKPRQRWSTQGLRVPVGVDVFANVTIYVDKAPPQYREEDEEMLIDGKPAEEIPYFEGELPKGTRVYVDGRLVGWVKRRYLADKLIVNPGEPGKARFSVGRYLESFGVDLTHARAVDLMAGDDLAHRVGPSEVRERDGVLFSLANHMKGKVKVHLPGHRAARITSMEVYVHATPPAPDPDPDAVGEDGPEEESQQDGSGGGGGGSEEE